MIPQQYLQKLEVEKTIFDHSEKIKLIKRFILRPAFSNCKILAAN
tara:strand:- start:599 stop:733 length:135 start_codon:yes stop_codon:yes gene_type:complete